jgi:ubiquinone biosynthesis protein COQ4
MSIRDLLAMNLLEARAKFGIGEPTWYKRCHEVWQAEGIDPYDLLGKEVAKAAA